MSYKFALSTLLLCISFTSCKEGVLRKEIAFSATELQTKMAKQFPVERKEKLAKIKLANPEVLLRSGTDRIGMRTDLRVKPALGKKSYSGQMEFDAAVQYLPEQGEFKLVDSRVKRFELDNVPTTYQEIARSLVNQVLKHYLDELTVYKLNSDDFKESLAKLVLKKVMVKEGHLVLEIGLL